MPKHIALNLITLLEKCKCEICQKELKKIKEEYGLDKVNKGQAGNVQAERLNPEDTWIKTAIIDELFDDNGNLKSICDSPNCDNK